MTKSSTWQLAAITFSSGLQLPSLLQSITAPWPCLVTEAHRCEQLAQGCYAALHGVGFESTTC